MNELHSTHTFNNYNNFYLELESLLERYAEAIHKDVNTKIAELKLRASLIVNPNWLEDLTVRLEKQNELVDCLLDMDVQIRLLSQKHFNDQDCYHRVARSVLVSVFTIEKKGVGTGDDKQHDISNNYLSTLISGKPESFYHFLDRNRYLLTLFILSQ